MGADELRLHHSRIRPVVALVRAAAVPGSPVGPRPRLNLLRVHVDPFQIPTASPVVPAENGGGLHGLRSRPGRLRCGARPAWARMTSEQGMRREVSREQLANLPATVAAKHDLAATAAERREIGRQARVLAPRGDWATGTSGPWARPCRQDPGPKRHPAPRAGPAPPPAHVALAVELLPGRRRRHGGRPGLPAAQPHRSPALRGRPRPELRALGHAGRNLNFDLRDFDETLPGPFEWDVARLAASLVVAARENGVKPGKSDAAVTAAVDAYRNRMRYYATSADPRHLVRGHPLRPVHRLLRTRRPRPGEGAVREGEGDANEPWSLRQAHDGTTRAGAHHPAAPAAGDARRRRAGRCRRGPARWSIAYAPRGPSQAVRPLYPGGYRSSGRRGRQRRHGGLPRAARGKRNRRSALPAMQAGRSLRLRAFTYASEHDNHGARVIAGKRMVQSATDIFVGWGSLGDATSMSVSSVT